MVDSSKDVQLIRKVLEPTTMVNERGMSLSERRSKKMQQLKIASRCVEPSCTTPRFSSASESVSQILDFLYLGNARDSQDIKLLEEKGITHIVNATCEQPNLFEKDGKITYLRVAVHDNNEADLMPHFKPVNEYIDTARREGGRVLVHCRAGISRSASLVIAYILAHSTLSVMEAFNLVNRQRPIVCPSIHFFGQLERFHDSLWVGLDYHYSACADIHPVEEIIIRRCKDFHLDSQPHPCSLSQPEFCHGDPIKVTLPPSIKALV